MDPEPFISRVRLRNFRSIADCDVTLGPLTVLIGPNGSGKSNFLQALRLLGRAVSTTPYEAVAEQGGLDELLRRVPESAQSFSIDVEMSVPWGPRRDQRVRAAYGFEIGRASRGGLRVLEVLRETCTLDAGAAEYRFSVRRGVVDDPVRGIKPGNAESIVPDRLYLLFASVQAFYAPLLAALSGMRFYSFSLDALREPSRPSAEAMLAYHGEHLSDVIAAIAASSPDLKHRVDAYLGAVVPGIQGVDSLSVGGYLTMAYRAIPGSAGEVEFSPAGISDGTIRATAVLAALFQPAAGDRRIPLVGIEEPEIALHPAAAGVLFDALTEASERVQVIVTTQSPDLLDRDDLSEADVRAVSLQDGVTTIGEVDKASRQIVRDKLYTLGELMRGNQLFPEPPENGETERGHAE